MRRNRNNGLLCRRSIALRIVFVPENGPCARALLRLHAARFEMRDFPYPRITGSFYFDATAAFLRSRIFDRLLKSARVTFQNRFSVVTRRVDTLYEVFNRRIARRVA